MNINTERLSLRRIKISDAEVVAQLANDPAISATTMRMPYPCSVDFITDWFEKDLKQGDNTGFFTISLRETNNIIGVIGLEANFDNERAELGFWVGSAYWNKGYCTEAALAMLEYGFNTLHMNRIWTFHIEGNHASGRVLEKIGMVHEGTHKKHIKKNGEFRDLEFYGKLKSEIIKIA